MKAQDFPKGTSPNPVALKHAEIIRKITSDDLPPTIATNELTCPDWLIGYHGNESTGEINRRVIVIKNLLFQTVAIQPSECVFLTIYDKNGPASMEYLRRVTAVKYSFDDLEALIKIKTETKEAVDA